MPVYPEFPNVKAPVVEQPDLAGIVGNNLKTGYTLGQLLQGVPQRQAEAEAIHAELVNELTTGKIAAQPFEIEALKTEIGLAPLLAAAKYSEALKPMGVPKGGVYDWRTGKMLVEPQASAADAKATRELGTIDGRLVIRDPYTERSYFEGTMEPVTDFSRLVPIGGPTMVYMPDPQGAVYGFPSKGPEAGKGFPATIQTGTPTAGGASGAAAAPTTEPFIKQTPQSEKITAEVRAIEDADAMIQQMKGLYDEIVKEGDTGLVRGTITKGLNLASGGAYSPKAQTYTNLKNGFLASLRGMTGDDARFSDADAARLAQLLAGIEQSPQAAARQWTEVFQLLDKRKQIRWADEKLGRKAPVTQPAGPENAVETPAGRIKIKLKSQ